MDTGYIYFVGTSNAETVKIGWALNPWTRIRVLQTGFPSRVRLHALARGSLLEEHQLHHHFRACRLHGEWFASSPDLLMLMMLLGADHLKLQETHKPGDAALVAALFSRLIDNCVEGVTQLPACRRASRRL